MKDLVESLVPVGTVVFDTDASAADLTRLPYVLVLGDRGVRSIEETLEGRDSTDGELTVRVVGETRRSISGVHARVDAGLDRQSHVLDGHRYSFVLEESRPIVADFDVTVPGTSKHPLFQDHVFRLFVQKVEVPS